MQDKQANKASRRGFFLGAASTGAAAVAVVALPGAVLPEASTAQVKPAPEKGGGYSLSAHVKQYYKTTLL